MERYETKELTLLATLVHRIWNIHHIFPRVPMYPVFEDKDWDQDRVNPHSTFQHKALKVQMHYINAYPKKHTIFSSSRGQKRRGIEKHSSVQTAFWDRSSAFKFDIALDMLPLVRWWCMSGFGHPP